MEGYSVRIAEELEAYVRESAKEISQEYIQDFMESFSRRALEIEDIGWTKITGSPEPGDAGFTIEELQKISQDLEGALTNPLHKRGAQLRQDYVFGRGVNFNNLSPKTEQLLKKNADLKEFLSVGSYRTMNLARFTSGNYFVMFDVNTWTPTVIPISQITGIATDPDDNMKIRYIKRTWTSGNTEKNLWIPLARYRKTLVGRGKANRLPKSLGTAQDRVPVAQDKQFYFSSSDRLPGWTLGVPDSLAAKLWTLAYTAYLQDNATLVRALSQIAWKVTSATARGVQNAAVSMGKPGVGGTAATGAGNDLQAVGVPSAQVSFDHGQPLAAMVATSFGVPVIALLSSPGAGAGSYGTAQTLDVPTLKGMRAVQDSWVFFFEEILRDMGSEDVEVRFPSLEEDPAYRYAQAVDNAVATGLIWPDEGREAIIPVLDIQKMHDGMPPKPENITTPGQGRQGPVPGGVEQGETNHDPDNE